MSLLFSVQELQQEIQAFGTLADRFLAPGSAQVLATANSELIGLSRSASGGRWQIREDNPLLTLPSDGEFMPDDQGGLTVFAEITFVWHLEPVRTRGDTRAAQAMRLSQIASTQIRILEGSPYELHNAHEIAMWKMEIADRQSPGTFFHVQVFGREADLVFPHDLDVPRLPGVLNSPFACAEFVLGELFQRRWAQTAMKDTGGAHQWHGIQRRRHTRHLEWVIKELRDSSGSPWAVWKAAQPADSIFMP